MSDKRSTSPAGPYGAVEPECGHQHDGAMDAFSISAREPAGWRTTERAQRAAGTFAGRSRPELFRWAKEAIYEVEGDYPEVERQSHKHASRGRHDGARGSGRRPGE